MHRLAPQPKTFGSVIYGCAMSHYITRVALDRHAPEQALRPLLDPIDKNKMLDAHRRLMWILFPDRNAKRDFLWRAEGQGRFLVVSSRKPQSSRLFKPLESKSYEPALAIGDDLAFVLRVNATKDRPSRLVGGHSSDGNRSLLKDRRVDIVMHSMQERALNGGVTGIDSRAARRMEIANTAARQWLQAQGRRRGFLINSLYVEDYRVLKLGRGRGREATFGVLDLVGKLTVQEPDSFTHTLLHGIGRARSFGCGLMLVRRV